MLNTLLFYSTLRVIAIGRQMRQMYFLFARVTSIRIRIVTKNVAFKKTLQNPRDQKNQNLLLWREIRSLPRSFLLLNRIAKNMELSKKKYQSMK